MRDDSNNAMPGGPKAILTAMIDYGERAVGRANVSVADRLALNTKRARYRRERRAADRAARGLPVRGVGAPGSVWTPEMVVRLRAMVDQGRRPGEIHRAQEFPGLTFAQITGRWQGLSQSAGRGGVQYLGLGLAVGPPPDLDQIAERDDRVDAENAACLYDDPNHKLLGDPSPQRLAIARELDRRGMLSRMGVEMSIASRYEDTALRPFSISAVPASGPRNQVKEHV